MINTTSVTDLKQNTANIIRKLKKEGQSILILQRSQPAAVLIDPDYFNVLEEALETANDIKAIDERKDEPTVTLDEVSKKLKS